MKLIELQILFQQKIEDMDQSFRFTNRPTTFTIVNYMNRAVDRFLREKYLNIPSHKERINAVLRDSDILKNLIKTLPGITPVDFDMDLPFSYQRKYYLPDDIMVLLSLNCQYTRSAVPPISSSKNTFVDILSPEEAERLVKNDSDKPIYPKPFAMYDDQFSIVIAGDAYTTAIDSVKLRYLRKHFDLHFDYAELTGTAEGGALDISAISNNSYFRTLSRGTYNAVSYYPGDKVKKLTGYNSFTGYAGWIPKVGYPYGYIDELEFPEYIHEQIIDIAVLMFIDEAKFKLIPKQTQSA